MSEKVTKEWLEGLVGVAERTVSDFAKVSAAACSTKQEAIDKCKEFIAKHLDMMKNATDDQAKAEHAGIVIQARELHDALRMSREEKGSEATN